MSSRSCRAISGSCRAACGSRGSRTGGRGRRGAAGAIAAARIGAQAGFPNLVACDMGGTSFDVSLIAAGEPALSAEKDIAYGVPLRVPLVDIHTIGAGGGSIARITRAGLLQVGPESAGAHPGPIAYSRGGTAVTGTDANLVLGES